MADAVKSPSIPADEQSQLIYIQSSGGSSVTLEELRGNNNNSDNVVLNNNQINMFIEQQQQNDSGESLSNPLETPRSGNVLASSNENVQYVNAPNGLFPMPLSKTAKTSQISRLKFKFKFLGKFMAKAVMDSRMVSENIFIIFSEKSINQ
jgi:hypothetical protein